jgi:hypothetical protein
MAGVVDTVGSSSGARPCVNAPIGAAAPNESSAILAGAPIRNPQIIHDPTAGFITQYMSSNGQVVLQSPSAIAVAYLKQGLAADGTPKPETAQIAKTA